MKQLLFTVALCIAASASFAQKKAVNESLSIAKGQNPDFGEARTLINGALENAETKGQARTWYAAGFIEDQVFTKEKTKQILGQTPNEDVQYQALIKIFPYFEKAYTLDQQPNEKGKIKPKYTKDIKSILGANHLFYINGGAFYFEKKEYKKAYDFFEDYLRISDHPMFTGEEVAARDSNFMMVQYYAAIAATQLGESKTAIAALERAKNFEYKQNEVYQYLCYEYINNKDSVSLQKTLEEGFKLFPDEQYFLISLINRYIDAGENEKAIDYLNKAIEKDPKNTQLYDALGSVYENGMKDIENAEKYFSKALEIDPEHAPSISSLGRVYFNQGVNKQSEANLISDTKKYQEELEKAKDFFRKALPYYEKVHKLQPNTMEYTTILRGIYYNLEMGKELEAIEKEIKEKEINK